MPLSSSPCPAIVIGGGISGLACAYRLQKSGIPVRLLEAGSRAGGMIASKVKDGFLFDLGPQSFLTTEPLLGAISDLGLKDQLLRADRRAPRYIFSGGKLIPAPLAPPSLFTTPLFGARTKWRLLTEFFRRTKPPEIDESIAVFLQRKFGEDLLNNLVAPFVSGVYAGDPERLSLRAAFPKLYEFEQQYGSVLRGAMKSRPQKRAPRPDLSSFLEGMETLPRALAARLGDSLSFEARVVSLRLDDAAGRFEVSVQHQSRLETLAANVVIVATPTVVASEVLQGISGQFLQLLPQIEYAPVAVVSAGYRREQFQKPPDGFGFLVPRGEGLRVLGTVFNSSLFVGRVPKGMVSLTSFAGGATDPDLCKLNDTEITKIICGEVARVLGIKGEPVIINLQRHPRALPQYNLGHTQLVKSLEAAAAAVPGLFLTGNYLAGPSIGACVEQAFRTADAASAYLSTTGGGGVETAVHA